MIEEGRRVLLIGNGREYFVRAGAGKLSTDLGTIDLAALVGKVAGDQITTHLGTDFIIRVPKAGDFFSHAPRTGAPMLPKDIGLVIAYTGMCRHDRVLDAGTGSGIAAIFFGGIADSVTSYEHRPEFAERARKNIEEASLPNVEVIEGDVLSANGTYDIVHLDLMVGPGHIEHAYSLISPGGYLAVYTPYIDHASLVLGAAEGLFSEVHSYESIEREITRTRNGTRPSTRICHSGYVTIARK
ncbi:MAG: protein-L-isoaspartate carboxylmethyltransferase [Methanoregulaceae archaeon]|nr:protein-L-isoaspartate carboxylmethyltransferase [Methanoregulaceae archaeon]